MDNNEFNRRCAEALGWEKHKNPALAAHDYYILPEDAFKKLWPDIQNPAYTNMMLSSLHFHSSYDWAMLLVPHAQENNVIEGHIMFMRIWSLYTPQQIAQAALEVLEERETNGNWARTINDLWNKE